MKITEAIKNLIGWEEARDNILKKMIRRYIIWNATSKRQLVALRDIPIINFIKKIPGYEKLLIFDVGSGSTGIAQYWKQDFIGLDTHFDLRIIKNRFSNIKRCMGTVVCLPFRDSGADIVTCIDMLEHISPSNRGKAIEELLRVASRYCIIAVPCGEKSQYFEERIDRLFEGKHGIGHPFIREHLENGLPEAKEIVNEIRKCTPDAKIKILDNTNLYYWFLMHLISDILIPYPLQFYLTRFREFIFSPLFLVFKHIRGKTTYRKLFICDMS